MGVAGVHETIWIVGPDGDNCAGGMIQQVDWHITHRGFLWQVGRNSNIVGPNAQAAIELVLYLTPRFLRGGA